MNRLNPSNAELPFPRMTKLTISSKLRCAGLNTVDSRRWTGTSSSGGRSGEVGKEAEENTERDEAAATTTELPVGPDAQVVAVANSFSHSADSKASTH